MPIWALTILGTLGATLAKMGLALVTEKFIKRLIVDALQVVVNRTETPEDNKLLETAKEAWGLGED